MAQLNDQKREELTKVLGDGMTLDTSDPQNTNQRQGRVLAILWKPKWTFLFGHMHTAAAVHGNRRLHSQHKYVVDMPRLIEKGKFPFKESERPLPGELDYEASQHLLRKCAQFLMHYAGLLDIPLGRIQKESQ